MTSRLTVLAVALALASPGFAQQHRDFSGTWTLDLERSESPSQGQAPGVVTVEIVQTPADLTVVTLRGTLKTRSVYAFGPTPPAPGAASPVGRAVWEGEALVTEGTRIIQGQTVSTRETRTLNADGTEMTVRTILMVQHGYEFRGAKNYGSATDVYKKAKGGSELSY